MEGQIIMVSYHYLPLCRMTPRNYIAYVHQVCQLVEVCMDEFEVLEGAVLLLET